LIKRQHRVILRADGNSQIGLGHIMRLLGLSEILRNDFRCIFITRNPDPELKRTIESFCKLVVLDSEYENERKELNSLLDQSDIVVLDGYDFDEKYQQFIKSKVHKLVMIDDKAEVHFYADLLINHGGNTLYKAYIKKCEPYTRLLIGADYLILRKEFINAALEERKINKVDSVFICMGGADPFNITGKAVEAALKCPFLQRVIVVTGNAFTNHDDLNVIISRAGKVKNIIHEQNVTASRIVELIGMCEIAICPSSTMALEACCVKVGLLTGTVIDNQNGIHSHLKNSGCCLSVSSLVGASTDLISSYLNEMNNITVIQELIQNQKRNFDGRSSTRILEEFQLLSK
jgi:UDP-2,4-diacetamido-2,4,6-trideoxy-beta-L-altropyranose hydrolase